MAHLSTISVVARSRESIWLALAGGFIAVGAALLAVAGAFDAASQASYSFWTSVPMIIAYVMFGVSLGCFGCASRDVPIPFPLGSRTPEPVQAAGPVVRPDVPARIEVVRQAGGWIEDQGSVQWLTRFRLSRELWGDPERDFFNFLRRRRTAADQLAQGDDEIREHLSAALGLVPDYSRDPDPYGLPERNAVGILAVTINLLIKVRNLGTESGGVTLTSSAERVLRPPDLRSLGAWVEYRVKTDEARYVVAPGTPVDIPATVWIGCARDVQSNVPVDTSHAIAIARVSRAFVGFLCRPIEGIEVDAVLDGGDQLHTALEIRVRDAANRCAVSELDVDELERHAQALDEAIDQQRFNGRAADPDAPAGDA